MKTFILLVVIFGSTLSSFCNIQMPRARISEISFDSDSSWTIELGFFAWSVTEIDSIRIETSSGSSVIDNFTLIQGGGWPNFDSLALITNLNLVVPITINQDSDYVKLISYIWGNETTEYVAIGNYPGSVLDCISDNESICYLIYEQSMGYTASYCIDKSPTIGFGNDTSGALSTFSGFAYDLNGEPFSEGWFPLPLIHNTVIRINSDGSFSERIFSRRHTFDTIKIYFPATKYNEVYEIEPMNFCLRPDSIHIQDIITTSLITSINEQQNNIRNIVTIFPNPFTNRVKFYFKLDNFKSSDEISLVIYSQNGNIIEQKQLAPNQIKYEWLPSGSLPNGILIYRLLCNGKIVNSGKLVRL